jgi:hypothetical protein
VPTAKVAEGTSREDLCQNFLNALNVCKEMQDGTMVASCFYVICICCCSFYFLVNQFVLLFPNLCIVLIVLAAHAGQDWRQG